MSWLETDFVMTLTISKPAVTMMEVIVDHQISLNGQNVPTILHLLEMEHVMNIWKSTSNAIMMPLIVVQMVNQLEMENVIQKI